MKKYALVWVALWALLCWGASPSVADLDNPGGSIDRIEKDIEQIQRLIATNKSRLESYQEQVKELTEAHKKAEEKAADSQREYNQVKEEFNAARAKAVEAQVQCEDTRKKVLQKQQEEPEYKQLKTLLDLTQRDWEAQQARVLLALSEQAEYQGLQTLLGDARLRADPMHSGLDSDQRLIAANTLATLESQIVRMERDALDNDKEAASVQKKLEELKARMEIASKTQLENVEKHPEYLSAVKAMEEARQEQISAQKAVDQARMKDAQSENAMMKSSQRREVAVKNVDKAEKESERLENMLRAKRSDLLTARRRR